MRIETVLEERLWSQRAERKTLAVSFAVHVLVLCLLARMHHVLQPMDVITEVALLEPGIADAPPAAAAPAPAAPAAQTQSGALRAHSETKQFRRVENGPTQPDPQSDTAFEDRMNARLATLQRTDAPSLVGLATVVPNAPQLASPAGLPSGTGAGALALRRAAPGGGAGGSPLALVRGGAGASAGNDLGLATLPAERAPRASSPPAKALPRRSLAGVSLAGPIADRPVLVANRPVYPEWAKQEAIEGSVTLHFVVLPDGTVKDDVLVEKTAGFADFDDNAVTALQSWRFAALPTGRVGDQWGTVTFQYRLVGGN